MRGIYFHWPFCLKKCPYCDFFTTYPLPSLVDAYHCAIIKELNASEPVKQTITSVYFGGGTPSLMTISQLAEVLEIVKAKFELAENVEITLEANPDDLNSEKLQAYLKLGINRLSLGGQSFLKQELELLGRTHKPEYLQELIEIGRAHV